jgi:hypothetical protein
MSRRKRLFRLFALALLTALGLALVVLVILVLDKPLTKKLLFSHFSRRTGALIAAEKLNFRLFPLKVEVNGLKATGKFRGQDMGLELGKVEAVGSLGRLFSRSRPLFTGINVEDARLRITVDPSRGRTIDWQAASKGLQRLGPLQIRNAGVEMSFPEGRAEVVGADLDLRSSGQMGVFVFSMSAAQTAFASDRVGWSFAGSLRSGGELQLGGGPAFRGEVTVGSPRGVWNKIEISPAKEIAVRMRCEYLQEENRLSFSELEVSLPSLARAWGPLQVQLGKKISLDWNLRASLFPAAALEHLKPFLSSRLAALDVVGEIAAEGELRLSRENGLRTEVRLRSSFANALISHSGPEYSWRSSLSGFLNIEGILPEVETAGRITVEKGELCVRDLSAKGISARSEIRLTPSFLFFPFIQGRAEKVRLRIGEEDRALSDVAADGQGRLDRKKKRMVVDSFKLKSREFSPFHIQADIGLGSGSKRSVLIKSSGQDLDRALRFFHPLVPGAVSSWNPEGKASFEVAAEGIVQPERIWHVNGVFSAEGLRLDNPGAAAAAAELAPGIRFSGDYSPSRRVLSFECSFSQAGGESLWREFYIDWASRPLRGRWRGTYHFSPRKIAIEVLECSLLPIGRFSLTGCANAGNPLMLDLEVSAFLDDPASFLALVGGAAGKAGLAASWSGALSFDARLKIIGESFSLAGHLQVQDGSVGGNKGGRVLTGIEARFPFRFLRGGGTGAEVEEVQAGEAGYLSVEEVRGSGLTLGPLRLDLMSFTNRWLLRPMSIDLWGGRASVGATTVAIEPGTIRWEGRTSLAFRDGDLARAFPAPAGGLLTGGFEAAFPSVEISPDEVTFQGEAGGSLFSGSWTLRNLRLEQPFSAGRTVRCDVSFAGLNLEQMTDALPFGRVTGIVRGEIEGLSISYGQPESFSFRLESVKKEGVRQTFSLKAVDSLTILSQGEGPVPSQAFFLRFVPAFPYEKIGIRCSLKNDVFLLGGMIEEDGVEYLVRRARPFGINIINRDPNKMISFKDMVSRLKRIGASKKTENPPPE